MEGVAHNLIHIKCAEVPAYPADFSSATLRFFYAWKKYPYESRALPSASALANNLIHIFCAELHRPSLSALEVAYKAA